MNRFGRRRWFDELQVLKLPLTGKRGCGIGYGV